MKGICASEAWTLRSRRDGDVLVISVSGVYTDEARTALRRHARDEVLAAPTRSIVVNLLGAVHATCDQGEAPDGDSLLDALPVAVIVSPAFLEAMTRRCDAMWERGFFWVPFVDPAEALSWAKSRRPSWRPCGVPQKHAQPQL